MQSWQNNCIWGSGLLVWVNNETVNMLIQSCNLFLDRHFINLTCSYDFLLQVVAFILIGVAAYGRAAAVVTSLTLVGSLIACGVFLFLIAINGLIGALRHHQVLLFFVSFSFRIQFFFLIFLNLYVKICLHPKKKKSIILRQHDQGSETHWNGKKKQKTLYNR